MELRQLAAFVAVADELHFGRGAEALGSSQPAISQLVRRLESEIGVLLFERSSHHVRLTSAGSTLLPLARKTLKAQEQLELTAGALARGAPGTLRIATTDGIAASLALLVERFATRHRNGEIGLQAMQGESKFQGILDGSIDVAFTRARPEGHGLAAVLLWQEPLVAVLPTRHPAATASEWMACDELAALPLVLVPRHMSAAIHEELLEHCRRRGLEPRVGPELRHVQETIAMISSGAGWTLLTESNAPIGLPGITVRELPDPPALTGIWLVSRATAASSAAVSFVEMALEAAQAGELPVRSPDLSS